MSTRLRSAADDLVASHYEPLVKPARQRFHTGDAMQTICSPESDPELLDRFLINFCGLGVQMTEPVEGWIRRAGLRTEAIGMEDLGRALRRHARHEADHHLLMIRDVHKLVALWNGLGRPSLDAAELLESRPTPGIVAYINLHEKTIAGDTPFAQLGIEYEIEMLSITAGAALMKNVASVCGQDRVEALSFLDHHIDLDEGHTEFNRRQLERLLLENIALAEPIAEAGSAALDAYNRFLEDCLHVAR